DWDCLLPAALIAIIPAMAMVILLRRGAPLLPRVTLALAALAMAALANFALRLFHLGDLSIMVLFWHLGSAVVLSVIAAWFGPYVLRWRHGERLAGI
ncbi:MAG TPA: NrsF family protein, partial [Bradyrhizobium sp.]|nr:NrsF family protein [Bradyrhizobium sp.]